MKELVLMLVLPVGSRMLVLAMPDALWNSIAYLCVQWKCVIYAGFIYFLYENSVSKVLDVAAAPSVVQYS
jgi:hypothetical protein